LLALGLRGFQFGPLLAQNFRLGDQLSFGLFGLFHRYNLFKRN
jgi:hypothetical protein